MNFASIQAEYDKINIMLDELKSATHNMSPYEHLVGEDKIVYTFTSFYDADKQRMDFTMLDSALHPIKMMHDLPPDVLAVFGRYVERVRMWERGDLANYPFSPVGQAEYQELVGSIKPDVFEQLDIVKHRKETFAVDPDVIAQMDISQERPDDAT